MKTLLLITLASLVALAVSTAREVTLEWDANPPGDNVTLYRLEMQIDGEWVPAAEPVPGTEITLPEFPDETTSVRLFARNAQGLESLPSEVFTVLAPPAAPTALRIKINISIAPGG